MQRWAEERPVVYVDGCAMTATSTSPHACGTTHSTAIPPHNNTAQERLSHDDGIPGARGHMGVQGTGVWPGARPMPALTVLSLMAPRLNTMQARSSMTGIMNAGKA
jgi:hypothetical protein